MVEMPVKLTGRGARWWRSLGDGGQRDDAGDTPVAQCQYDGLGRRTVKLVLTSDPCESKVWDRTDCYNGAWQVVEGRFADGSTTSATAKPDEMMAQVA